MMKAIAIDDEPLALDIIETYCQNINFLTSLKVFTNTDLAFEYILKNKVDVLLLDINMPAISGIDFYKSLPYKPLLIFTTSYSEFALESYELHASDYLLKPFSKERFMQAILHVKEQFSINQHANNGFDSQFIILRLDAGDVKIYLNKILYVKSLDNYLKIFLTDQTSHVVRLTMKGLVEKLEEPSFVRIHKSFLISLDKIEIIKSKSIIIDKEEIPIGKNFDKNFRQQFDLFQNK
ncbi:LytR/AlgR family response regulator transcription factor [Rhizosphaericola mali]|uniref:Response regulator transcription factor n=1 Tax=Rhizosphaericola mali TaxID=2545455 RepID=A0A5P2G240_9BACT|nr:LytTR family DNA-binding domain-containing protein [Rhizosphaericola mali]QES88159.1 response regulator transcription factor [Rhizosphaericola mali]